MRKPKVDKVKVTVRKRHVKAADFCGLVPGECYEFKRCKVCPIAQALVEKGFRNVIVRAHAVTAVIDGRRRAAHLPRAAQAAISDYDVKGAMATPLSFSLEFLSREWYRQNIGFVS